MPGSSEKLCLKWNDFQKNITSLFRDLRSDIEFSDVTLVCDEDQQVEVHKIILKSCSPFFSKVLTKNKHSHPWIYMRGTKAKTLGSIVDFIYYGEANIYQEDLNDFLVLAEELQLKGLSGNQSDIINEGTLEEPKVLDESYKRDKIKRHLKAKPEASGVKCDPNIGERLTNTLDAKPLNKLDTQIMVSEEMTKEELEAKTMSLMERVDDGILKWKCTVCGKAFKTNQHTRMHIETHSEGLLYACNLCGKVSRLVMHLTSISVYYTEINYLKLKDMNLCVLQCF